MYKPKNPYQESWWEKKTFLGLSRNDALMIAVMLAIIIAIVVVPDWDFVFGLRPLH
ncbi:MAG: hypothetical protein WAV50_03320 [Minisyncoccia bacterium]